MNEDLSQTVSTNAASDPPNAPGSIDDVNSSDTTRLAILDAVVRCFAAQGWAGTNMSLVARETRMTRGKIQYYFPVLEDLKFAAIEYLHEQSRRSYFAQIAPDASARTQFDRGIDLLWEMANDPYHIAMAEVAAASRTDPELRRRLAEIRAEDEIELDRQAQASFPALAAVGLEELRLGRLFTTIFINGLAAHSFPSDTALWQSKLIDMLKECLVAFWTRRGVAGLEDPGVDQSKARPVALQVAKGDEQDGRPREEEVLALLRQAASLLANS